eukprot:GFUD01022392.1.p1 GENE.GFUD01022392.1~~GFUD01022392.1.p1  ORF type:complete len:256 (-),score=57.69 GFUD01022392.1:126-893(-)
MVPTLRSMCLQKVLLVSPRINEALPTELLDDLIRMKVFNGKFSFDSEDVSGSKVHKTALSIQYDGVSWTFKSCCQSFPFFCCYNCDDSPRQEEHQFTVTEGEQVQLTSTFGDIMNWEEDQCWEVLQEVLHEKKKEKPAPVFKVSMTMSVELDENKTYGEIIFCGSEGSVPFKSTLHVDFTWEGTRVVSHKVEVNPGYTSYDLRRVFTLYECSGSAEDSCRLNNSSKCRFTIIDSATKNYCPEWDYTQYCYLEMMS